MSRLDDIEAWVSHPSWQEHSCCSFPASAHYNAEGKAEGDAVVQPPHEPVPVPGSGVVILSVSNARYLLGIAREAEDIDHTASRGRRITDKQLADLRTALGTERSDWPGHTCNFGEGDKCVACDGTERSEGDER